MRSRLTMLVSILALIHLTLPVSAQENWPQWRGPELNGLSKATGLPTDWSESENIAWKTPLPSWSGATPIIWGDRVFITSPSKPMPKTEAQLEKERLALEERARRMAARGRRMRRSPVTDPGGQALLLLCLSKKDGTVLWQQELDQGNKVYRKHNNTSPSPVTDGKHVWVITGTGVINAFDMAGNKVWQKKLQEEYGNFGLNWGYASSPLLYNGKLIIEVLHGMRTDDPSYIAAFDAASGEELWRKERLTDADRESPDAYTTPALLPQGDDMQLVITGGDYVTGHQLSDGKEIWRVGGMNPEKRGNYRVVASPLVVDGMLYAPTRKKPLLAFNAGGADGITSSSLAWKWDGAAATDVPTPVSDGQYFYMVDDRGLVICLEAKTGKTVWGPERTAQGNVSASPILADGKLYLLNEKAVSTVIAAGPEFKILATNELDGSYTLSSPAVSGSQLFIRTSTHLYCIGQGAN